MSNSWQQAVVKPDTSIIDAIKILDQTALQIVLVTDALDTLLGVVTDGDIRRALLNRIDLNQSVEKIMNHNPMCARQGDGNAVILARLSEKKLRHMPIVDATQKLLGLKTINDLIESDQLMNPVVLMAGGLGTRLGELTCDTPKPMLEVGGKPILQTIIERFVCQGFKNFYIAVNYKADIIKSFFADGAQLGASIKYLDEDKKLGTAGALSLLPSVGEQPIFVMNADVLTKVDFKSMLDYHQTQNAMATMAVREYEFQVPFGVVGVQDQVITQVDEKPTHKFFVNAGIYILSHKTLARVPKNQHFDMTTLFSQLLVDQQKTTCFPLREYWLDIGRVGDFKRAGDEFDDNFNTQEVK